LVVGTGTVSAAVTVSGRIVAYDDTPIANRRVYNYGDGQFNTYTDSNGRFSAETSEGARLHLVLYDISSRSHDFQQNSVPLVYSLGDFNVGQSNTNLGDIGVPQGFLVDMRALDSNGNPVEGATPGVRHNGSGIGESYISTNGNGWAQFDGVNFRGLEAAGRVELSMSIPTGGGEFSLSERVTVDGPKTVTFQIGEGVTVSDAGTSVESTSTATQTPTETTTATTDLPTDTATPTATADVPTDTVTPSDTATATGTDANASTSASTQAARRGFFGNGESAGEFGPLEDPFVLTVGGFALSVAGIAHQMLRGH
jgi:hypothetical protein